ncbi:MAG TPA: RluA family pseudouridine synthase [Longimicrobium sp.]|jgi:23S rRNA pseudouridine1911/1915/1917 synthase|uniref:RluA family pseudouridine synthase n=1 Tax=Longimicrobium sp. TaxID=2029185 RepID=UPI002EDA05DF
MAAEERIELLAGDDAGERLDTWLAAKLDVSRSRATQLIEEGRVTLNGAAPKKRDRPAPGDRIEVRIPPPAPSHLAPEAIPLAIVHQDDDLLVIDKPAGLVVHPAPGNPTGTLVNALLHAVGDLSGIGGVLRPGIVHRLDKDTSGLMVVAKHDDAHRTLSAELKARRIRRAYLTAAWGHLPQDEVAVDAPIGRHPTERKRMAVVPDGRLARTRFIRLERWRAAELLRAELDTGRTHQIRVHLLHLGHPVVGDRTYAPDRHRGFGGPERAWAAGLARRVPRQFLHATELRFTHPRTGEPMRFDAPLPPDLAAAAEWARGG